MRQLLFTPGDEAGRAELSACGTYRYTLWRPNREEEAARALVWIMLNPSTADAERDDPTIRKCRGFSERWGFGGAFTVVNLFALRATDPRMLAHPDPVGPLNDAAICSALRAAEVVVCAWGMAVSRRSHAWFAKRRADVERLLEFQNATDDVGVFEVKCLGRCKDGNPRHPLMQAYETPLEDYLEPPRSDRDEDGEEPSALAPARRKASGDVSETVSVIACDRQSGEPQCHACGRPATGACEFELRGRKTGTVCDRPVCANHAHVSQRQVVMVGNAKSLARLCHTHHEMERKELEADETKRDAVKRRKPA